MAGTSSTSQTSDTLFSLSLLLSGSCELFCIRERFKSFLFKQIRTLSRKHRGWSIPRRKGSPRPHFPADGLLPLGGLAPEKRGLQNEIEHWVRVNAEQNRSCKGQEENDAHAQRESHRPEGHGLRAGLVHVHHHDHAQIIISADHAVDGHQRREPQQVRIDGGFENIKLSEESGGNRQPEQRKKVDAQGRRYPRLPLRKPGVVVERKIFF